MCLFDIGSGHQVTLSIKDEPEPAVEKNWTPFISSTGALHFVYKFDRAQTLQCSIQTGECNRLQEAAHQLSGGQLRGGTPLLQHDNSDFFFGFARTTTTCSKFPNRFYRPHLVVLHFDANQIPIAHVSSPYDFENVFFRTTEVSRTFDSDASLLQYSRVITAGGIVEFARKENLHIVAVSVNDNAGFLVLLQGLRALVSARSQSYLELHSRAKGQSDVISCAESAAALMCDTLTADTLKLSTTA
ncbi:hypothetical protein HDU87_001474 [Geranomyces variabilis]|uniref:Uncharacterized protein n=1 Tax=Geranomyces variabilis TaxID=109894 RepID=A0AAD5TBT7_9FUNG|nr:hypothetical protein HDU87_001474 [Geranomyces variabilis]